jgi:hypothetical protein
LSCDSISSRTVRNFSNVAASLRTNPAGSPTVEELDSRGRDLANFTLELREILQELMQALAARPKG